MNRVDDFASRPYGAEGDRPKFHLIICSVF